MNESVDWDAAWEESPKSDKTTKPSKTPYIRVENSLFLIGIENIARLTTPINDWRPSHKKLFNSGVRVGQCYRFEGYDISIIGHTNTGFKVAIREVKTKKFILRQDATIRKYIKEGKLISELVRLLRDEKDEGIKPGRELDATLASIRFPASIWNFGPLEEVHVSICSDGHYVFTDHPLTTGHLCPGKDICLQTQKSSSAKKVLDILTRTIETGGSIAKNKPWIIRSTAEKADIACLPYAYVNNSKEKPVVHFSSGSVISLIHKGGSKPALVTNGSCGFVHAELLSGDYKKKDLFLPLTATNVEDGVVTINQTPSLGRCTKCNKPGIVFNAFLTDKVAVSLISNGSPLTEEPESGAVYLNKQKQFPVIVRSARKNIFLCYSSQKRLITVSEKEKFYSQYKKINKLHKPERFFSKNNLSKFAPIGFNKWVNPIVAGTKLYDTVTKKELTCLDCPIKINNTWLISVIEKASYQSLTELTLPGQPEIELDQLFETKESLYRIISLKDQKVVLRNEETEDKTEIPLLGFSILFELNFIRNSEKLVYTVDFLYQRRKRHVDNYGKSSSDGRGFPGS